MCGYVGCGVDGKGGLKVGERREGGRGFCGLLVRYSLYVLLLRLWL